MTATRKEILCQYIAVAVLITLLCSERAPAAQNEPANRPMLPVPVTDAKPVIDGKPDEACWKSAATTGILKVTRAADENLPMGRASSLPFPSNSQAGSLRHGTKPTAARLGKLAPLV